MKTLRFLLATACALALSYPASSQVCNEERKFIASGGVGFEELGFAVALDGSLGLVGAKSDDENGTGSGSATLFDLASGDELRLLLPNDGAAGDGFGFALAVQGGRAVVGALSSSNGAGAAYLFDTASGAQVAKLLNLFGGEHDRFGGAVAIDGGRVIVGAQGADAGHLRSGKVLVYDAATGAMLDDLRPSDPDQNDFFGTSVALSGTRAIVGSTHDDDLGDRSGSAYLFDLTTGEQTHKLLPLDGSAFNYFGTSVAIEGNTAVVGAVFGNGQTSGAAYLFDVTTGLQLAKLVPGPPQTPNDGFGQSLDVHGNVAIVGAQYVGEWAGAAYLYDATTGAALTTLLPSDGAAGYAFGVSASIDGDTALVGASGDGAGSAYSFRVRTDGWSDLGQGLVGSNGVPQLAGCGAIALGDRIELTLSDAAPNTAAILVLGTREISVPFRGGTLVPNPGSLVRGLVTDAGGNLTVDFGPFRKMLPTARTLIAQFWVFDTAGPQGFAASNAVRFQRR